jgi:hypothetical protein
MGERRQVTLTNNMNRLQSYTRWCICLCIFVAGATASPSVRYLHGRLQAEAISNGNEKSRLLDVHQNTTVSKAWRHCQGNPNCVSFGFQASARFPGDRIAVSFYSVADWHVNNHFGQPAFVEEESWHLYVNVTREISILKQEVDLVLRKLHVIDSTAGASLQNNLRIRSDDNSATMRAQEKTTLIISLSNMVQYKQLRVPCSKLITRPVLKIAMDDSELEEIRVLALQVLLAMTDSYQTPPLLEEYGILAYMENLIYQQMNDKTRKSEWGMVARVALDIVSNMALHRTAEFPFQPTRKLLHALQQIVASDLGSIGLQASLTLIHASLNSGSEEGWAQLPSDKLVALVDLLEATIDGDPVFGYDWDLIPGPLSAIQTLVQSNQNNNKQDGAMVIDKLVGAGLMEQLVRLLEAHCLDAETTLATLQVMNAIRTVSPEADEMVAMAASSIHSVKDRLELYETPTAVARSLALEVAKHKFHRGATTENHEL